MKTFKKIGYQLDSYREYRRLSLMKVAYQENIISAEQRRKLWNKYKEKQKLKRQWKIWRKIVPLKKEIDKE